MARKSYHIKNGSSRREGQASSRNTRHGLDTSFENMIVTATGREAFDLSVSTIHTSKLETIPVAPTGSVDRTSREDPEGTILEDNYSGIFGDTPYYDQESQAVLAYESSFDSTCPTDSFDSGNRDNSNPSPPKTSQRRRPFRNPKGYVSFDSSTASTSSTLRRCCMKDCTYCLLCFAVFLVGLSIAGTAMIVLNVFEKKPNAATSNATSAEYDSSSDDLVGPVTVTAWTSTPTSLPTFFPTHRTTSTPTETPSSPPQSTPSTTPSIQNSQTPSIALTSFPSAIPTSFPTAIPTNLPTSHPSSAPTSMGPTTTPSQFPTRIASERPSSTPTKAPTRSPVDMSQSVFYQYLDGAVQDPAALADISSPQGRALEWLENEDKIELDILRLNASTPENRRTRMLRNLYQRFAMVALDFALHDTVEETAWSFPRLHVCLWTGAKCNEAREVNGINWARMNLTGTIPPELGLLTNVVSLDIAQNRLKGFLDPLYNLTAAVDIFVFENQLSGPLTRGLEQCQSLTRFMAGHNQLTGQLPALNMDSLRWFNVHHNGFTGAIPWTLALENVKIFDVTGNQISGQLPLNFVDSVVPSVRHLYLGNNRLNGTVPEDFVNLGRGRALQIYMNDNQLSGGFPTRFEEIKHLTNLDLSNNLFTQRLVRPPVQAPVRAPVPAPVRPDRKPVLPPRPAEDDDDNTVPAPETVPPPQIVTGDDDDNLGDNEAHQSKPVPQEINVVTQQQLNDEDDNVPPGQPIQLNIINVDADADGNGGAGPIPQLNVINGGVSLQQDEDQFNFLDEENDDATLFGDDDRQ
ncbi:Receptor-like [Seminavis robusta]|uniref:Receptor-like n=1 Tax=Seminavis robusta TaxID=568900 RepID=A0A9N8DUU4_9STRA|nr:Receptor-like [Seminavis robusta]|eukprot:Sro368_g127910.1 Receptor-like (803) ;mRNA; r:9272-12266